MKDLTLSKAMRLGAMSTAQGFGYLRIHKDGKLIETCAIGAAMFAANCSDNELYSRFPLLQELRPFPEELRPLHVMPAMVIQIIVYLNDVKHWSREKIADWVATLESEKACIPVEELQPA